MKSTSKSFDMVMLFNALADRTRLRLLNLMRDGEVCVCYFVETIGTNQPKISRHLAYLRRAGIVAARREGKWMHYKIAEPANPAAQAVLRETLHWLAEDREMQGDREHLHSVCCASQRPIQLEGAPIPISIQRQVVARST